MKRYLSFFIALLILCTAFAWSVRAENAVISGFVWLDKNGDGTFDNEKVQSDVTVSLEKKLEDGSVSVIETKTTDTDGTFSFHEVQPGEYRLSFNARSGFCFTTHGIDSAALPASGAASATPFFPARQGDQIEKNAGIVESGSHVMVVSFLDANANGGRMTNEAPVEQVNFTLLYEYDGVTYAIASAKTNGKGEGVIRELSPGGSYTILAEMPENITPGPLGSKLTTFHNCFVPGEGETAVSLPFSIPYRDSVGLGLGLVRAGSLKGNIRFDADGTQTSPNGAPVVLLTSDVLKNPLEAKIDQNGDYSFTGLQPGDYELVFRLPEGCLFSDKEESLLRGTERESSLKVSVQEATTTNIGSVLYSPSCSLSLYVMEDRNLNGVMDEGETPLEGVTAELTQHGSVIGKAVTDAEGKAYFPTVRQGEASILVKLPDEHLFTDSVKNEQTIKIDIAQKHASLELYAVQSSGVSGLLFDDPENSGIVNDKAKPLSGFTVMAIDRNGKVAAQAVTDGDGAYHLRDLLPTEYTIRFLLDDNYIAAPYADIRNAICNHIVKQTPDYGDTAPVVLPYHGVLDRIDGAFFKAGIIDGYILSNENHDGLTTNEGGIPGAIATLIDENNQPISDYSYGITDENGYYCIKGVLPGRYAVSYKLPEGCLFNCPLTDNPDVRTEFFRIDGGAELHLQPLGAVNTASVSGRAFRFSDREPMAGVLIRLTSEAFGVSMEQVTQDDGLYSFDGLRPDIYALDVQLPAGYVFADTNESIVPGQAVQSISSRTALKRGRDYPDSDIALDLPAAVTGMLYYDRNMDSAPDREEPPVIGREVIFALGDVKAFSLKTDENGVFQADSLVPGNYTVHVSLKSNEVFLNNDQEKNGWKVAVTSKTEPILLPLMAYSSISGRVWNLDGSKQDIAGIPVFLYDDAHRQIGTAETNAKGEYCFERLLPGVYTLDAKLPEGYLYARKQDTAENSSYIQSSSSGNISFLPIEVDVDMALTGIDIGMGANGTIGDFAWLDENGNGMQDIGESPLPGIRIDLYQYDEFVTSITTDATGHYRLENLYPGEYEMRVTMPKEIKPTVQQTEFPLVASILPDSKDDTVTAVIVVPSGGENLHMDLGFRLVKKDVYPECMKQIAVKDWTPYAER